MKQIVCVFGASITWGHFDPEGGGWVNRSRNYYEKFAAQDSAKKEYTKVYNLGVSGETSGDLLRRFSSECSSRRPDVIIISIGINDAQYVDIP